MIQRSDLPIITPTAAAAAATVQQEAVVQSIDYNPTPCSVPVSLCYTFTSTTANKPIIV